MLNRYRSKTQRYIVLSFLKENEAVFLKWKGDYPDYHAENPAGVNVDGV